MTERNSGQAKRARARLRATGASCYLCGEAIDYKLPMTDPKSFVVDHVIPLAKGGQDALSNMKAAHRRRDCNSKKRARIVAPIVRRSGSLSR